jgi:alanine dehydrogenase
MNTGVPKERKVQEYSVALTPEAVHVLTGRDEKQRLDSRYKHSGMTNPKG